ncbi:unnamed protein product [Cylindrotheca closterium]|uniref:Uncharacterized protein n=1 Tax=Cylindrotheca closterium TaxID=2856 RepID=A0AAD2FW29_9STRA|nr:unnamed protein product [Cylindrotheca closterium]
MADKGARRGSSLFSNPAAAAGAAGGGGAPGDNQGPKRQSVVLSGLGGGVGFGIDFDDSDYDDSDDEDVPHGGPYGGQGLPGQAMPGSAPGAPAVTGAQNSRPMVGGFAAAAYEAARAHHFQNVAKQNAMKGAKPGQPGPPPKGSQPSKKLH